MVQARVDLNEVLVTPVRSVADLDLLAGAIRRAVRVAVDTETHAGLVLDNGMWAALRVVAVAVRLPDGELESYVVDVRDVPVSALAPVLAEIAVADAWNANFDDRILELAGCPVRSWRDSMHIDGVLHSGASGFEFWHGLAFAAKKYLGVELDGKGTTQVSYDGESDLSDEQFRYPGIDAAVTLLVAEQLDKLIEEQGLTVPVSLEVAARPFILEMTKRGLPLQMDRWKAEEIGKQETVKAAALAELASLTGGSEITLFGESENPSWNPDSDVQVRDTLNKWATDAVKEFTGGRLLEKTDKLDKTSLKQIKHPITKALLKYRDASKILSTYGDNLDKYVGEDGRIRPEYKQGGVVATGRLASDKPNAQNFSPKMKPYFRPSPETLDSGEVKQRCFVYADLSQAELRVLAQVSVEERMRDLFRLGGDFHARTAADMFQVDMDGLKDSAPAEYSNHRKKAKGVNFGIPYGLGAAALAQNLSVNSGLPTTVGEAREALDRYAKAYPEVDKWLSVRDKYVKALAQDPGAVDWDQSFALYEIHVEVAPRKRSLKRKLGRPASALDISVDIISDSSLKESLEKSLGREPSDAELDVARDEHVDLVNWALGFDAPVVLKPNGEPWTFESRSLTGRRRLFTVPMDSSTKSKYEGVVTAAMLIVCTSDKPPVAQIRAEFAEQYGLKLPVGVNRLQQRPGEDAKSFRSRAWAHKRSEENECIKEFEGDRKKLKYELLKMVRERMGSAAVDGYLLPMAMGDQIRSMGNKFRNHPIQSLVADVGLQYYADLAERLKGYRNAFPVQAVHDSIAIECDLEDAPRLCVEVQQALESALAFWCPDVPAVADADIRLSLSDDDVVDPADVPALLARLDAEMAGASSVALAV